MGRLLGILFAFVIICYMADVPADDAAGMVGNAFVGTFEFLGSMVGSAGNAGAPGSVG